MAAVRDDNYCFGISNLDLFHNYHAYNLYLDKNP